MADIWTVSLAVSSSVSIAYGLSPLLPLQHALMVGAGVFVFGALVDNAVNGGPASG